MAVEKDKLINGAGSEADGCCAPGGGEENCCMSGKEEEECCVHGRESVECCAPGKEADGCCAHGKGIHAKKKRSEEEYRSLRNRLKRIEGQVRGILRMLDEDAYCPDILIQVSAVNSALNSFNRELLESHIRTCVKDDILSGNTETIEELVKLTQKLMR